MGNSVQLRACGGIAPYTWSKTGSLELSDSTGTQITVTSTGGNTYLGPEAAYMLGATIQASFSDAGPCGSGGRLGDGTVDASAINGTLYDCAGNVAGVGTAYSTVLIVFNKCGGGTCNVNNGLAGFSSQCGNVLYEAGRPITVTVSYVGQVHPYTGTGTLTQTGGSLVDHALSPSTVDLRTQAMIDGGCTPCILSGGSGGTVTVTDDAGVSVTYTF